MRFYGFGAVKIELTGKFQTAQLADPVLLRPVFTPDPAKTPEAVIEIPKLIDSKRLDTKIPGFPKRLDSKPTKIPGFPKFDSRMSEVWNHFTLAPNALSVTCHHCGKFMKRSDSSTKSMWGHLNSFHKDAVGEKCFQLKRKRRVYPKTDKPKPAKASKKKLGSGSSTGIPDEDEEACTSSIASGSTPVSRTPGSPDRTGVHTCRTPKSSSPGLVSGLTSGLGLASGQNLSSSNLASALGLGTPNFAAGLQNPQILSNLGLHPAHIHAVSSMAQLAAAGFPLVHGYQENALMISHLQHILANPELLLFNPLAHSGNVSVKSEDFCKDNDEVREREKSGDLFSESKHETESEAVVSGVESGVEEEGRKTPTQPYVKRKRSRTSLDASGSPAPAKSIKAEPNLDTFKGAGQLDGFHSIFGNNGMSAQSVTPLQQMLLNAASSGFNPAALANMNGVDQTALMSLVTDLLKNPDKPPNSNSFLNQAISTAPDSNKTVTNGSHSIFGTTQGVNFGDIASLAANDQGINFKKDRISVSGKTETNRDHMDIGTEAHEGSAQRESSTEGGSGGQDAHPGYGGRNFGNGSDDRQNSGSPSDSNRPSSVSSQLKDGPSNQAASLDSAQPKFSLGDPNGLFAMHQIALDLELTYSAHGRRGYPEFNFESNRTAERSGARGRMVSLTETADEIHISERVNGFTMISESWAKTDLTQLVWAIRGKCQKVLCK
ncbi:BED zinc finger domain-containing protein [Ditylenchus destructor]|uniref:BED zinc finger domain-containing protein n=1 Tax=Ditylenchus destructor TaxID=166010 RepID=A0AAD4MLA6_9BILA|nr:BED zinc finger domain-containing protein [Ditylenchus destructor]